MNFKEALDHLQTGHSVKRSAWAEGDWANVHPGENRLVYRGPDQVPCTLGWEDLCADDWEVDLANQDAPPAFDGRVTAVDGQTNEI